MLGSVLVLYSLGYIESLRVLDLYWPVGLILVGVAYLIYGVVRRDERSAKAEPLDQTMGQEPLSEKREQIHQEVDAGEE